MGYYPVMRTVGSPAPVKQAVQIQEGGKDYLLSERNEEVNKVIQGKSEAVWTRGKAGWLVPHGEECSNQVTSCVCPPVRMKETDDPDQDCAFLDNLPQMLGDLRAGWGPPAFSEESGLSPSLETALSCTELAGGSLQCLRGSGFSRVEKLKQRKEQL